MYFKKLIFALLPLCILLSGCCLKHQWTEATCTEPKTCNKCNEIEGVELGHTWQAATCSTAKTCSRCGLIEGKALGHTWQEATCTTPKTCTTCNLVDSKKPDHTWAAATCTEPPTCTICGVKMGLATGHSFHAKVLDEKYLFQAATITTRAKYYYACEGCGAVGTSTYEHGDAKESAWVIGYYVDYKFGEATDDWYVSPRNYFEGVFSNSATNNAGLMTKLLYDVDDEITIFLYEYKDEDDQVKNNSSSYSDVYNISIKNDSGTIIEANGKIYPGGDRLYIESKKSSILDMMKTSKYMKFYIQEKDTPTTVYQFEVDLTDFAEVLKIAQEEY